MTENQDILKEPSEMEPQITIGVKTPEGFPAQITFSSATVAGLTAKTRKMIEILKKSDWTPDLASGPAAAAPGPAQAAGIPPNAPTFGGFACNPEQLDALGRPKFIYTPDGRIAHQREGQGDLWYSIKTGDTYTTKDGEVRDSYDRILFFRKGEPIPEVRYPQ